MSVPQPARAILLSEACRVLRTRLAANAGLDRDGDWLDHENEDASYDIDAEHTRRDQLFAAAQDEADFEVQLNVTVSRISVWQADGKDWRLIPPEWALHQIAARTEESRRFFVDRTEFESAVVARHPVAAILSEKETGDNTPAPIKRKPGPEPGPGYSLKDVPNFKLILEAQRQSGNVETKLAMVTRFAGDPNGVYYKSNIERRRKGLPKWLVKIGEQWSPN